MNSRRNTSQTRFLQQLTLRCPQAIHQPPVHNKRHLHLHLQLLKQQVSSAAAAQLPRRARNALAMANQMGIVINMELFSGKVLE